MSEAGGSRDLSVGSVSASLCAWTSLQVIQERQ